MKNIIAVSGFILFAILFAPAVIFAEETITDVNEVQTANDAIQYARYLVNSYDSGELNFIQLKYLTGELDSYIWSIENIDRTYLGPLVFGSGVKEVSKERGFSIQTVFYTVHDYPCRIFIEDDVEDIFASYIINGNEVSIIAFMNKNFGMTFSVVYNYPFCEFKRNEPEDLLNQIINEFEKYKNDEITFEEFFIRSDSMAQDLLFELKIKGQEERERFLEDNFIRNELAPEQFYIVIYDIPPEYGNSNLVTINVRCGDVECNNIDYCNMNLGIMGTPKIWDMGYTGEELPFLEDLDEFSEKWGERDTIIANSYSDNRKDLHIRAITWERNRFEESFPASNWICSQKDPVNMLKFIYSFGNNNINPELSKQNISVNKIAAESVIEEDCEISLEERDSETGTSFFITYDIKPSREEFVGYVVQNIKSLYVNASLSSVKNITLDGTWAIKITDNGGELISSSFTVEDGKITELPESFNKNAENKITSDIDILYDLYVFNNRRGGFPVGGISIIQQIMNYINFFITGLISPDFSISLPVYGKLQSLLLFLG